MRAADFATADWRKSSRSNGGGGSCVEVATVTYSVGVRDSKLGQSSPIIGLHRKRWNDLLTHLKSD